MKKGNIIFGSVVAVLLIATGVHFYRKSKNKKLKPNLNSDPSPSPDVKPTVVMASSKDAYAVLDVLNKKDESNMTSEQITQFVQSYVNKITLSEHVEILKVLDKPESTWTTEDKVTFNKLLVIMKSVIKK